MKVFARIPGDMSVGIPDGFVAVDVEGVPAPEHPGPRHEIKTAVAKRKDGDA